MCVRAVTGACWQAEQHGESMKHALACEYTQPGLDEAGFICLDAIVSLAGSVHAWHNAHGMHACTCSMPTRVQGARSWLRFEVGWCACTAPPPAGDARRHGWRAANSSTGFKVAKQVGAHASQTPHGLAITGLRLLRAHTSPRVAAPAAKGRV